MMKEHNKLCFKAAATCTCKCWLHSVTRIVVKRCASPLGKLPAKDILFIDNKPFGAMYIDVRSGNDKIYWIAGNYWGRFTATSESFLHKILGIPHPSTCMQSISYFVKVSSAKCSPSYWLWKFSPSKISCYTIQTIVQTEDNSQSYDDWWEMQSALESVCTPHAPTCTCTKVDY